MPLSSVQTLNPIKMPMSRRLTASFVLAALILAGAGALLYRVAMQFRENRQSVSHTHQVIGSLQDLWDTVEDAETGARGYILTGDDTYLAPYEHALSTYENSLAQAKSLMADNSLQLSRLAAIKPHIEKRLTALQQIVDTRKSVGMEAARQEMKSKSGRREMEVIRAGISEMQSEENRLLDKRKQSYEASVHRTSDIFGAGIILQSILLLLVFIVFIRDYKHRAETAKTIENAKAQLSAILSTTADGLCQVDSSGKLVYLNRAAEKLLGYKTEEILGVEVHGLIHSRTPHGEFRSGKTCPLSNVVREGVTYTTGEDWFLRKDGTFLTVQCTGVPLRTGDEITGAVFSFHDISERQQRDAALRSTMALQRAIFNSANVSIISTDAEGLITTFNAAAERMLLYEAREVVGKATPALIHDPNEVTLHAAELTQELGVTVMPGFDSFVARTARTGVPDQNEWTYIRKDGTRFPVQLAVTALRDPAGKVTGFMGIAEDITKRKKAEDALRDSEAKLRDSLEREKNVARVDFLTGILNRRGFFELASTESQRARRYQRPLALIYVDLDNFKMVNDSMGHDTGDALLVQVAATIHSAVRGTDIVGRLGGDEFAMLLPETDHDAAMVVVEKVQRLLRESMKEKSWPVTFSIGMTCFRLAPESVEEMVRQADTAMYSVKLKGKNSLAVHSVS